MYRYTAYSITIDSELELPDLAEGKGEPDVVIRLGSVSTQRESSTIANEVAFVRHIGRLQVKCGREIVVDLLPDADPRVVRSLLQGRLMTSLLRQRGYLPLHVSGVAIEGRSVLFMGESGAGKSTTAAAFYARGYKVLTDDIGAVRLVGGSVELQIARSGLRLLEDARKIIQHKAPSGFQDDKHVFHLERPQCATSFPVKRIYFLEYGTGDNRLSVRTDAILGSWAVALLNSHSFLLPWRAGDELLRINLDRSASIAAVMPLRRLVRPQSLDFLPELVDLVEKDVKANE